MKEKNEGVTRSYLTGQADIKKVRDASTQVEKMGVPEQHLGGHAFHTYRCVSTASMLITASDSTVFVGSMQCSPWIPASAKWSTMAT